MPSCFERNSPRVRRLFEDYQAAEMEYYRKTRIFPIMHTVVIRTDVLDKHPWLAASLYEACERSKKLAYAELFEPAAPKVTLPWLMAAAESTRKIFGTDDYWSYGMDANNRETVAAFLRYSHNQGLIPYEPEPEDLFCPSTLRMAKK
jgi:4,5-dihydroxyphthalate decarboxylase